MQSALKLTTRVLPGKRVEFTAPELVEGEDVELIVLQTAGTQQEPRQFASAWEYLQSFKPIERTLEEWAEIDREFYEERNSWGDAVCLFFCTPVQSL